MEALYHPIGNHFSQLVLILAQITEETPTEDYEFEFFRQACI